MIWLLCVLCFVLGVVAAKLIPAFKGVAFAKTVDPGNILNAFATLLVAVLINFLYTRQASARRAETELLKEHAAEVKQALHSLHRESAVCNTGKKLTKEQQATVTLYERELSNSVHSLEQALKCCGAKAHKFEFEKLKDARAALKERLTDTPFPGPYDLATRAHITSAFKTVRDELTRVSVAINRW